MLLYSMTLYKDNRDPDPFLYTIAYSNINPFNLVGQTKCL